MLKKEGKEYLKNKVKVYDQVEKLVSITQAVRL